MEEVRSSPPKQYKSTPDVPHPISLESRWSCPGICLYLVLSISFVGSGIKFFPPQSEHQMKYFQVLKCVSCQTQLFVQMDCLLYNNTTTVVHIEQHLVKFVFLHVYILFWNTDNSVSPTLWILKRFGWLPLSVSFLHFNMCHQWTAEVFKRDSQLCRYNKL